MRIFLGLLFLSMPLMVQAQDFNYIEERHNFEENAYIKQENTYSHSNSRIEWVNSAMEQLNNNYQKEWEESIIQAEERLLPRLDIARDSGEPFLIWVNIPAYKLRVIDSYSGETILESRVIVGSRTSRTPVMDTKIVNLKFNPDWSPPKSATGKSYTPSGPSSPLGRVRFSTNNDRNIYLHDTNARHLYNRKNKALSLGCIRVEEWRDLSLLLSGESEDWLDNKTKDWKTRWVNTPDIPVYIDYQLVDFDESGQLTELRDIYNKKQ